LIEIAGPRASGKTALALRALASAMGEQGFGAFLDGRGELYPPAAPPFGIDLQRLLVVRGEAISGAEALWAAEALLASGAFEAVVLDVPAMGAGQRAAGGATWEAMLRRVRAAAEKGGGLALWLAAPQDPRIAAAMRLEVSGGAGAPRVRCAFARNMETASGGAHHAA
jgi:protein ImuA